ncbi:MAG: hypothetical protein ACT4OZ_07655 [Gemmatimonadota bacterium]
MAASRKKSAGKATARKTTAKKTTAKKATAKKTTAKKAAGSKKLVSIRMYNVGFGDCFLVTLPTTDGPRRVLFDCGSIKSGGPSMDDIVDRIIADCTDDGTAEAVIDVVVCTHRHKDHVSGFSRADWDRVRVSEVWMPWIEHPTDPEARRIREAQAGLALALDGAIKARLAGGASADDVAPLMELVDNALSNESSMAMLHDGFAGNPRRRFLPTRSQEGLEITCDVLPGIGIFVLGPSRKESVIRDMDPPSGKSFLRLRSSLEEDESAPSPFSESWVFEGKPFLASSLSAEDEVLIQKLGELALGVAVALDKAVNGTSLMIVLKVGSKHLLFPGDAQWGTWLAAMEDDESAALLRKTDFYKVGHHGSHNATPRDFVEKMLPESTLGMCSTNKVRKWPDIPRKPLIDALEGRKMNLARSDKAAEAGDPFVTSDRDFIEVLI